MTLQFSLLLATKDLLTVAKCPPVDRNGDADSPCPGTRYTIDALWLVGRAIYRSVREFRHFFAAGAADQMSLAIARQTLSPSE